MENKLAPPALADQSLQKITQKTDFSSEIAADLQTQVLKDKLHDGEHSMETNLELNKEVKLSNTDIDMTDTSVQVLPSNPDSTAKIANINTQDNLDDASEKMIDANPEINVEGNSSIITPFKEAADEPSLIKGGLTSENHGNSVSKLEENLNIAAISDECKTVATSAAEESQSFLKITHQIDFSTEVPADLQTQVLNEKLHDGELFKEIDLELNKDLSLSNTDIAMSDISQQVLSSNIDSIVGIIHTNSIVGNNINITSNTNKELKTLVLPNIQEGAIKSEVLTSNVKASEIETEKISPSEATSNIKQVIQPSIETDVQMGHQSYRDSDTSDSSESSSEYEESESSEEEVEEIIIEDEETKKSKKKLLPEEEYCPSSLPKIQDLTISVPENECLAMGKITSIIDNLVVVQAIKNTPALDEDSVLFLDKGKKPLGKVFDTFGCVSEPSYVVRFNSPEHIQEKEITVGMEVLCAPRTEHSHFVLISQLMSMKGSDASGKNDIELPPCLQEFSDDEQEREARRKKKSQKYNDRVEIVYEGERPPQKRGKGRGQSTGSYRPRVNNNPFGSNYQQTFSAQREYAPRFQHSQNTTYQPTFRSQGGHDVNFQSVETMSSNYQPQSRQLGGYESKFLPVQNSGLEYQKTIRNRGGYGTRFHSPQNYNRTSEMPVLHPPRFDYFYENQQESYMSLASAPIPHVPSPRFQQPPPTRYPRFGGTPGWPSLPSEEATHQQEYFASYRPPRY